jgi:RNA polymerase sigma-70 factor (ECF subfamily)
VWGNVTDRIAELVERFRGGDDEAFGELVKLFEKKIYAHAYQMLGNHTEADEVLQETFVRLVKNIAKLRIDTNFSAFVYRIATNLCIDLIRKRQRRTVNIEDSESELAGRYQLELSQQVSTPDQELERKETLELIKKAISELPPRQQAAIILHDIEGYSKEEVAKIMGCPQATVRSNLHIARLKVKKMLSDLL